MMATLIGMLQVRAGHQLRNRHLEPAVADDGADRRPGRPSWAPIAGNPNPIVPGATGVDPVKRLVGAVELGGPHLVLADVGGVDRLAFR